MRDLPEHMLTVPANVRSLAALPDTNYRGSEATL